MNLEQDDSPSRQCRYEEWDSTVGMTKRCKLGEGHAPLVHQMYWDKPEAVNHPAHYGGGDNPYEHIKVADAWGLNYRLGNATKYIARAGKKTDNPLEDLKKAAWYLNSEIERLEGK